MPTQDILLTVFTGILAVAVLIQTFLFIGMYRSIRQLDAWKDLVGKELLRHFQNISDKVNEGVATVKAIGEDIKPVISNLTEITDVVHQRVLDVDSFLAETTDKARLEILRIQDRIESVSNRAEEAIQSLHNGILAPIKEIHAVTRGIRVAFDMLFRRRRSPGSSAQDEEMFI
jgi:hypothetical protein